MRTSVASVVGLLGLVTVVACGDGEEGTYEEDHDPSAGMGGAVEPTGGLGGTESGGTGGLSETGGASGGAEPGGGAGGEVGTGATGGTGAADTGGSGGTGAVPAGGSPETGGTGALGGEITGGSGGLPTGGAGGGPAPACVASFVEPMDGALLDADDDADEDVDGFQYDVAVATDAPAGTTALLYAGSQLLGETAVSGAMARFDGVTLSATGTTDLEVEIEASPTPCGALAHVAVTAPGVPTCLITAPTISTTHRALNGVPVAEGGDRVSSVGSAYQAAFAVATDVEDGQPVLLLVNDTQLATNAVGGHATFPGVTMVPDSDFSVSARCIAASGATGSSAVGTYPVDSTAPLLDVFKVKGGTVTELWGGDHWDPEDDGDADPINGLQLRICGVTTSADALDFAPSLGVGQQNLCVGIGTASPTCVAAVEGGAPGAGSEDGACIDLACPGSGSFELAVTLRDEAGNPTTMTTGGLTCASELPQVQFVDPIGDAPPWENPNLRILAASNPTATRIDQNAAAPGAQYTVTACTSAETGTARLLGARQGSTPAVLSTATVLSDATGVCSALTRLVTFPGVTLPESAVNSRFELATPTELTVEVTDGSNGVGTSTIALWVDSVAPTLSLAAPGGFCGSYINADDSVTRDLTFGTSLVPVDVWVIGPNDTQTLQATTLAGVSARLDAVRFDLGESELDAMVTEPSGNTGSITADCRVSVGTTPPPTVTWVTPTGTSRLGGAGATGVNVIPDADADAGWQGLLRVCVAPFEPTTTVDLEADLAGVLAEDLGLDGSGCAELAATLPEGLPVVLTATTAPVNGAPGLRSISVPVDVTPPEVPGALDADVLDRRATTFQLAWTAPDDGGRAATNYQIRVSWNPITTPADFAAAEAVVFGGAPAAAGTTEGITVGDRYIENDYYFAIAAGDATGNLGDFAAVGPERAEFNEVPLAALVAEEKFGFRASAAADLTGDGRSDVCVSTRFARRVYCFAGGADGVSTTPFVTFEGSVNAFGSSLVVGPDLNDDGLPDVVLGSPQENPGRVYVYYGREVWPSSLDPIAADVVIRVDPAADPTYPLFGGVLESAGDFNADGVDDLALGNPNYSSGRGLVAVVYGSPTLPGTITLPADYGTYATQFLGEEGTAGQFGYAVTSLPGLYSGGSTLVVGAPAMSSNAGMLYAFAGRNPQSSPVLVTSALHTALGPAGFRYGRILAPWRGSRLGVVNSLEYATPTGEARVHTGAANSGPFATVAARLLDPAASGTRPFGRLAFAGTLAGTTTVASFIGSSTADVVVTELERTGTPAAVYIVDGDKLPGADSADVKLVADVVVELPTGWKGFGSSTTMASDLNLDGYGDLVIPEFDGSSDPYDGRVVVLW
ncbi:MAG: FG-GAP repeat protein [Polyangiaceae bacterium]|nr:FG-GAP repeat protein [Polyangiaceae bacterium]